MLGLFRKKDPICGMKEVKGEGMMDEETGTWLCSDACKEEFAKRKAAAKKQAANKPLCCQ